MTLTNKIKALAAVLLICIFSCDAYAQETNTDIEKESFFKSFVVGIKTKASNLWKGEETEEKTQKKAVNSLNFNAAVSTNILTWLNLGTANLEADLSFHKNFSLFIGGKYNDYTFKTKSESEILNQQTTGYAGIKYWPWYVNTGWWVGIKGQYSEFATAGIFSSYLRKGTAVGGGLSGGYSFMLNKHFNLDLGLGVWGGKLIEYEDYEKPEAGPKMFFTLDNIKVSFTYVF